LHTHSDAQRNRLRRVGKTPQSAPNVDARRLGQVCIFAYDLLPPLGNVPIPTLFPHPPTT